MAFPTVDLDFDERLAAEELVEEIVEHPEQTARHIVALNKYCDLLERGLSFPEARGTVWGQVDEVDALLGRGR